MRKRAAHFLICNLRSPRGSVLIMAIGLMVVLTGMALVVSRQMRVEALASGNLQATLEADALADGAARYVVNRLVNNTVRSNLDNEIQSEAVALGGGKFWILRPNPTDETQYAFGVVDECSKINLNTGSNTMLLELPGMTPDLAASIIDWRDADENVTQGGAESEYYLMLPEPYRCKNSNFETLDELLMVKGADPSVLFGVDRNRNGVVDASESSAAPSLSFNGQGQCGVCKYLTVYGTAPNASASGTQRLYVGDNSRATLTALATFLDKNLGSGKSGPIISKLRGGTPARNVLDFYVKSGMTYDDFRRIADLITTVQGRVLRGLININTAPREVLRCLPTLEDSDVDQLIAHRTNNNSSDQDTIAWVVQVLPPNKAARIGGLITAKSWQYSADIVTVSANGRGFERCKYVFDLRSTPPSIVYRRNLTYLGWPLDPKVLSTLKSENAGKPAGKGMWRNGGAG